MSDKKFLNVNVGILGHVDSGKTSLAKVLSTVSSTASFDKNPQSQERGITIDLGFSSFTVIGPTSTLPNIELLQFTLVDCPGHASLIRTVIGGAQILDIMLLVIDVTKGIQTQTAECLIIGEIILRNSLIVVLNKIDLLPIDKKDTALEKMTKRLRMTLSTTKFHSAPIVALSTSSKEGLPNLIESLKSNVEPFQRNTSDPFLFSVDHCFTIKGQGSIMTGTVLQGSVALNDTIEIVALKEKKKVKSLQVFRQPVSKASAGDRIGLCVTQFDSKLLERGIIGQPGYVSTASAVIVDVNSISYYKGTIESKAKFHISLGHETVLASILLFENISGEISFSLNDSFEYVYRLENSSNVSSNEKKKIWCLLEFERSVSLVPNCHVLASKLDADVNANLCRIAFHGFPTHVFSHDKSQGKKKDEFLSSLKIYKRKRKEGIVDRVHNDFEIICRSMFKKETNFSLFNGLKVSFSSGEKGVIDGSFGKSGKFKVRLFDGNSAAIKECLSGKNEEIKVFLEFQYYLFQTDKKILQF